MIDKDPLSFGRLGKSFTGTTMRGMVFDRDVLERRGWRAATPTSRSPAATTPTRLGDDRSRDLPHPQVVARIFDPRRAEIYRRLGIQTCRR